MRPHQQRVVDEKAELDKKATALSQFIGNSSAFLTLVPAEQEQLWVQNDVVWQYSGVLGAHRSVLQGVRMGYLRCMLDLETYGTRPGCGILSIGAVFFSSTHKEWKGPSFYQAVNRASCEEAGLFEQEDTMAWWAKQGSSARQVWQEIETAPPLAEVLSNFSTWLRENTLDTTKTQVWGNGADFDNPILSACYSAVARGQPWGPYNGRCYRTLKALAPDVKLRRTGTHHNALDDAVSQAEHAVRILQSLKGAA